MATTFVTVAVDHDPATDPASWDWTGLLDHPEPVGVVGSVPAPEDAVFLDRPCKATDIPTDPSGAVSVVVPVDQEAWLMARESDIDGGPGEFDVAYQAAFGNDGFYTDGTTCRVVAVHDESTILVHLVCVPSYVAEAS